MKQLLLALTIASPLTAAADIIKCNFTEPFTNSEYSMTESSLRYFNEYGKEVQKIKKVSFQIKGPGLFELVAKDGTVLQRIELNNSGSDGMSDLVYPYDVKDSSSHTNQGHGGCQSNYLRRTGEG